MDVLVIWFDLILFRLSTMWNTGYLKGGRVESSKAINRQIAETKTNK